jgi:hypothetical protein
VGEAPPTMAKPSGYILYDGPSMLDGGPIIAIATLSSKNVKTGNMVQVWILRKDVKPTDAVHSGADASICGSCPHRGVVVDGKNQQRSCYVRVFHGPASVYRAYHRGNYQPLDLEDMPRAFRNQFVRLGAYGDPAAIPGEVIAATLNKASGWTGYTHSWEARPDLAQWCMASCDNGLDEKKASLLGFRAFRVTANPMPKLSKQHFICPASEEAGHKLQCFECGACNGNGTGRRSNVQIAVHGPRKKHALPVLQAG